MELGPRIETTDESLRETLRKLTERLDLALGAANMGVWEWNVVDNKVTWCQQIATMTGLDARASTFGDHRGLVHPDDREALFVRLDRAANGLDDLADLSFRFCRPGGGWRHMSGRALIERNPPHRATRIVVALTDASERRALEEALRQAQKVDLLGQISRGVAHDFRNILSVLIGNAQMLRAEIPHEHRWHGIANDLHMASEHAMELTNQLLSFARSGSFEPVSIDIYVVLTRLTPLLARIARRPLNLLLELEPVPGAFRADLMQVEQVLLNLVVNAREAMPDGGTIVVRSITRGRPGGDYVGFEVQDSGCGITESVKERMFEPFFTTKDAGKGTGLGLAVVARAVREWEGLVEVDSEPGAGATFRVLFPLRPY